MAPMKQTAFRLAAEDFAVLDAVKARMGQARYADALRYVLRYWMRTEGAPDQAAPKPKRTSKPKR